TEHRAVFDAHDRSSYGDGDFRRLVADLALRPAALFDLGHGADHEFLGVGEALRDELDVHGGFAPLSGALAIETLRSGEDKRICQQIECDGETSTLNTHAKLVFFKGIAAIFPDGHASS